MKAKQHNTHPMPLGSNNGINVFEPYEKVLEPTSVSGRQWEPGSQPRKPLSSNTNLLQSKNTCRVQKKYLNPNPDHNLQIVASNL